VCDDLVSDGALRVCEESDAALRVCEDSGSERRVGEDEGLGARRLVCDESETFEQLRVGEERTLLFGAGVGVDMIGD
jgi:hypothetical protein